MRRQSYLLHSQRRTYAGRLGIHVASRRPVLFGTYVSAASVACVALNTSTAPSSTAAMSDGNCNLRAAARLSVATNLMRLYERFGIDTIPGCKYVILSLTAVT